jgi:hypothetical protein
MLNAIIFFECHFRTFNVATGTVVKTRSLSFGVASVGKGENVITGCRSLRNVVLFREPFTEILVTNFSEEDYNIFQ